MKMGIEISYSWGDCEDGLYGIFETKEEAYKAICMLAAREAYVYNEEFSEERCCTVYFDAYRYEVNLRYSQNYYDDTWCYYRIREIIDEDNVKEIHL